MPVCSWCGGKLLGRSLFNSRGQFATTHKYCAIKLRNKKINELHANDPNYKQYMRDRAKKRWKEDPEYRKRSMEHHSKWVSKNRERINAYQRKYNKKRRLKEKNVRLERTMKEGGGEKE